MTLSVRGWLRLAEFHETTLPSVGAVEYFFNEVLFLLGLIDLFSFGKHIFFVADIVPHQHHHRDCRNDNKCDDTR